MLALGVILVLLSAGAFVAVLASGADERAALYSGNVELPTLVIFLAGAATLLVFIMGLELLRSGVRRANRNRKDSRRLRKLEEREGRRRGEADPAAGSGTAGEGRHASPVTDTAVQDRPGDDPPAPGAPTPR
jgi:hypothetical protein